jgi:hypothetical protein
MTFHDETAPTPGTTDEPRNTRSANKSGSATEDQSRYDPYAQATPGHKHTVRIEIVVIDGPDGKYLRARQAAAMLRALEWFAAHNTQQQRAETDPTDDHTG